MLNREVYDITFGPHHIPAQANNMSKKRKRFNYKQYKHRLREGGDMAFNNMHIKENCPTAADVLAIAILLLGIKQSSSTWNIFHLEPTSNNSLLCR